MTRPPLESFMTGKVQERPPLSSFGVQPLGAAQPVPQKAPWSQRPESSFTWKVKPEELEKPSAVKSAVRPLVNIATSPLTTAERVAKIPVSARSLYKEHGLKGLGRVPVEAGKMIIDPFQKLGRSILGGVGAGIEKLTGKDIRTPEEKRVYESVKKAITHPIETADDFAKVVYTLSQEDPMMIPIILQSGGQLRAQLRGKPHDYGLKGITGKEGPDVIKKVAAPVTETSKYAIDAAKKMTEKSAKQIEADILVKYQKGVKPLLPGKTTPTRARAYKEDVINAVKIIDKNKPKLKFTDDMGEIVTGKNPKSLQQLADSVEQTKKTIFKQYDDLAKKAGEAGVSVKMEPIAAELNTVINNKALKITNPKAVQYAQQLQARLSKTGKLDATTAQEVIQNYNKSLEAFYRNPTYDTASQAAIDAMTANKMRVALDGGISGLTGTKYQALKNQYGSLKAIERDVIKASLRDARKSTKGLIDFTDVFSGGQVVSGILTLNPASIAQGMTQKAIASFYKYLNNPNRAIEKMFKTIEKSPQLNSLLQTKASKLKNTTAPINPIISSKLSPFTSKSNATKKLAGFGKKDTFPTELSYLQKQARGVSYETFKRRVVSNIGSVERMEKIPDDVANSVFKRLQKTAQRGEFGDETKLFRDIKGRNPKRLTGNQETTIYRASPVGNLRAGDFVTTDKGEAGFYLSKTKRIYTHKVKQSDLVTMEGSMGGGQELIYIPKGSKQAKAIEYFKNPKEFWEETNK